MILKLLLQVNACSKRLISNKTLYNSGFTPGVHMILKLLLQVNACSKRLISNKTLYNSGFTPGVHMILCSFLTGYMH